MHGNIVTLKDEDVINIEFLIIPKYDKSSKYLQEPIKNYFRT